MSVSPEGFEGIREGVAVFDASGSPMGCDSRFAELLGLAGDGVDALGGLLDTHTGLRDLAAGGAKRLELTLADGRLVTVVRESAGAMTLLKAHDVAAGRDLSNKLFAASRAETVGRLCDGMAHDARNPLNAIVLNVEVLGERLKQAPELRASVEKYLKAIRDQVTRADSIIRHFVAFARPEREYQRGGEIDLAQIVSQAVEVCRHDARKRNVRIDARLAAVPVAAGTPELAHAILQLVMHGIDSSSGGTLQIALERQGGDAVLQLTETVSDVVGRDGPVVRTVPLHEVERLVGRLQGNLFSRPDGKGGEVVVRFPAVEPSVAAG